MAWNVRGKAGRSTGVTMTGRGLSVSKRVGPVAVTSRGGLRIRTGKRSQWRTKLF